MNEVLEEKKGTSDLVTEKVKVIEELSSRFRRQVLQAVSLQKKINILIDELKRLEISIKTSTKELNLSVKELKESTTLFTEAVDPSSDDWQLQYQLKKYEEQIKDCHEILESFFETKVPIFPSQS